MRNILSIALKDIRSSFVTPVAYVVITGFMLLSGFFFFTLLQQYNSIAMQAAMAPQLQPNLNEWVVAPFYQTMEIILIFLIPVLTMRSISEEKRGGTFELLITSPIKVSEIVAGKVFAIFAVTFVMLLLSFVYPLTLIIFADPEVIPIFVGFLGIVLFAWSFSALGVAVSACTKSQTVAGVISMVVLLVFYVIDAPAAHLGMSGAVFLKYLAPSGHADMFLKGVIQGSDLIYFFSVIAFGLFLANRVLDAERWR